MTHPEDTTTAGPLALSLHEVLGPTRDCKHGQLARSCDRCEDAAEIERLRSELKTRHERQHEAEALAGHYLAQRDEARAEVAAERERIAKHFDSLDKGVGGFYDPHEPAWIIRNLGPNVL